MNKPKKKRTWLRIASIVLLVVIGLPLLTVGGYVGYVALQYSRLGNIALTIDNNQTAIVQKNTSYKALTYNVGFGAYNHDFSFFMDSGKMLDGTAVQGSGSVAASKQVVLDNIDGIKKTIAKESYDFIMMQEVDTDSDRARKVNMRDKLSLDGYSNTYSSNFHSAYLFYPITAPHGKSEAGIVTMGKFAANSAVRKEFTVDNGFPNKFFDLDRCFSAQYYNLADGKQFVLANVHLSAYDEGGLIRAKQVAELNAFLSAEYAKGNYVVLGGDFNHDIADSASLFATKQEVPEWIYKLTNTDLAEHFSFAAATNAPTCRSTDMPYTRDVNYTVVIDGFIVSNNITVENVVNIDTNFEYSDHNPAQMTFKLKA